MGLLSSSKRPRSRPPEPDPPVTPGLGPEIYVHGRDRKRIKAMSPNEFAQHQRHYQETEDFLDRWARAGSAGGVRTDDEVGLRALHAWDQFRKNRARGMNVDEAAAWAANSEIESRGNYRSKQPGGPGRGLYSWGSNDPTLDRPSQRYENHEPPTLR